MKKREKQCSSKDYNKRIICKYTIVQLRYTFFCNFNIDISLIVISVYGVLITMHQRCRIHTYYYCYFIAKF